MAKYIRPTLKTKYHIDFVWWEQENQNLRRALIDQLCDECRPIIEADPEPRTMDWIDPFTAQVHTIDQVWHLLRTQCAQKPDFLSANLPLTALIFRLFIANDNKPLTPAEMHQQLQTKPSRTILKTIGGAKVYKGIRPVAPLIS